MQQEPKEILFNSLSKETKEVLNNIIQIKLRNNNKEMLKLNFLYEKILTSLDKNQILSNIKNFNEQDAKNDNILHSKKETKEHEKACCLGRDFWFYKKNLKYLFDYENFKTVEMSIKNSYSTISIKLDLLQYIKFNKFNNKINTNFFNCSTELFFNQSVITHMFINFVTKNKIPYSILLNEDSLLDKLGRLTEDECNNIIKNTNGTVIITNNFNSVVNNEK